MTPTDELIAIGRQLANRAWRLSMSMERLPVEEKLSLRDLSDRWDRALRDLRAEEKP